MILHGAPSRRCRRPFRHRGSGSFGMDEQRVISQGRGHNPLCWLAADGRDEVEVRVVMDDGDPMAFSGRRDVEAGVSHTNSGVGASTS